MRIRSFTNHCIFTKNDTPVVPLFNTQAPRKRCWIINQVFKTVFKKVAVFGVQINAHFTCNPEFHQNFCNLPVKHLHYYFRAFKMCFIVVNESINHIEFYFGHVMHQLTRNLNSKYRFYLKFSFLRKNLIVMMIFVFSYNRSNFVIHSVTIGQIS